MIRLEPKRPGERRDYLHDWTPFLGDDTIASQVTTASGVTVDSSTVQAGNKSIRFVLSAGTVGRATITQTITTAGGNIETETFTLPIYSGDEPVTVDEAKAQCRVTNDAENALIASYIAAAREWVENYTGHILVQREMTEQRECFGRFIEIRRWPVISVDEISYVDSEGDDQDFADFVARTGVFPARVYPEASWPSLDTNGVASVTYTAGYAAGDEPRALLQAMLLLIGHWFSIRGNVSLGQTPQEIPLATTALCEQFRSPL